MKINPYLNFDGKAADAFDFYKSVFGGEFSAKMTMAGAPGIEKLPEEEKNRIMHIALPIGDNIMLMASDILPSVGHKLQAGSQTYISIHPDSKEEADRLFQGLSKGGKMEMEIQDTFWGAYFGSFIDKFGIRWMINFEKAQ